MTLVACALVVPPRAHADDQSAAAQATVATTAPATDTAVQPKRWHAGVAVGVYVPRGDLDPGALLGVFGTVALDDNDFFQLHVGADWVRTGRHGTSLLYPGPFPRSRAEIDERADIVTMAAGGSARLVRVGTIEVRARLAAGLQVARTRLDAYAMSQVESGLGPAGTFDVSAVGRVGAFAWHAIVGWREARRDLGDAASNSDEVTSGAVIAVGAAW